MEIKNYTVERNQQHVVGWGNGYITVPKEHPWFGCSRDYIEVEGLVLPLSYTSPDGDDWTIGFDSTDIETTKEYVEDQLRILVEAAASAAKDVDHRTMDLMTNDIISHIKAIDETRAQLLRDEELLIEKLCRADERSFRERAIVIAKGEVGDSDTLHIAIDKIEMLYRMITI